MMTLMLTLMARAEQEQLMTNRGQYLTQQNENEMVKQELALLSPDAVVYKLVGPALIKQDLAEAKQNVDKRILFITTEMYVRLAATATLRRPMVYSLLVHACGWRSKRIETRSAEIEKLAERKRDQVRSSNRASER